LKKLEDHSFFCAKKKTFSLFKKPHYQPQAKHPKLPTFVWPWESAENQQDHQKGPGEIVSGRLKIG